jgi:hypothetical protein
MGSGGYPQIVVRGIGKESDGDAGKQWKRLILDFEYS